VGRDHAVQSLDRFPTEYRKLMSAPDLPESAANNGPTNRSARNAFNAEIVGRFGVLPNFFCTAAAAPGMIEKLWDFANSAYLDSPLPSVFKERLFVYLSRFCQVRYRIVRHLGFLIGQGHPVGDPAARPETIDEVIALLRRPLPDASSLDEALARLEAGEAFNEIPQPGTQAESDLFDALTIMFLEPRHAQRARDAVRHAVGEANFESLVAYLAFIRTAHYWTENHPELAYEPDMVAVMARHEDLARLLLDLTGAERVNAGEELRQALAELDHVKGSLRQSEERFRTLLAAPVAMFVCDRDAVIQYFNHRAVELWGRAPARGVERHCGSARLWRPSGELLPRTDSPIVEVLRTGNPVSGVEVSIERPDGSRLPVVVDFAALKDARGEITGVITCFQDITERKRAEVVQSSQRRALELLARGASLNEVIEFLISTIEGQSSGRLVGSVALLDESALQFTESIGSGLPDSYHRAVAGMLVSSQTGSCCRAVIERQAVAAADLTADPKWSRFAAFIGPLGFRSAWSAPIFGSDGKILGSFANYGREPQQPTSSDLAFVGAITQTVALAIERKRAEATLRESEAFTRRVLESSNDCIEVLSLDGELEFMSEGGMRVMEVEDFAALKGACWTNFWSGAEHEKALAAVATAKSGGIGHFRGYAPTAKGNMRYWDVVVSPISGDEGVAAALLSISRDISDQQAAEDALRASEERFRVMADNISQLAWMCDRLGEVTWYNKRWLDYTGLSFEEMKDWGWAQVQHPDHVDRVVASVTLSRESGEAWEDTFPLRTKDGEYRWFLSRAVPIRDGAGEIVRWFGTNTDITERRQAEEQRTVLVNELNHRVKNTLATVQSIAMQTLRSTERSGDAREIFESRLASLSRAHEVLTHHGWEGAGLRAIVTQALDPFRAAAEPRIAIDGPDVGLSPKQALGLSMALHELATNAVKYGALSNELGRVKVLWRIISEVLELTWVEESGPTVTPPKRKGFGSRLIERSLANELSGEVRLEYLSKGVIANIRTPLEITGGLSSRERETNAAEEFCISEKRANSSGRILIVEDEMMVAMLLEDMLGELGYEVVGPALALDKALAMAREAVIDAAILDVNLNGRETYPVAHVLRERGIPFVFASGYGERAIAESFQGAPILSKPFQRNDLDRAVSAALPQRSG
jgi:PAS domain S-box-containing protein